MTPLTQADLQTLRPGDLVTVLHTDYDCVRVGETVPVYDVDPTGRFGIVRVIPEHHADAFSGGLCFYPHELTFAKGHTDGDLAMALQLADILEADDWDYDPPSDWLRHEVRRALLERA